MSHRVVLEVGAGSSLRLQGALDPSPAVFATAGEYVVEVHVGVDVERIVTILDEYVDDLAPLNRGAFRAAAEHIARLIEEEQA